MKHADLIKKMTLEEKASLMSGKDFWQTMDLPQHGVQNMFLADGPHGIRKQMAAADHLGLNDSYPCTCFPTAATMANAWNDELGEQVATALGDEAVSLGVNVVLGPGINIKRNPLCGRNFEYFSEDPYLAGKMAAAYVRGIQSNGVSACLKHFAANNQEFNRMTIDSVVDERALREIYLTAFEMGVKQGNAKTIMSSYNKINGEYTNENKHLMREILRDEWGYEGMVVTDWGGSNDRIEGLKAGNELEMPTTGGETNRDIVAAVRNGELDESVLDECVDRLLSINFETTEALKGKQKQFDIEAHHKVAQAAAEETIVLLKNERSVLPLKGEEKIAIVGDFAFSPRFQGAGSSVVHATKVDNALSFITPYFKNAVGCAKGFKRYGQKSKGLIKKALKLAQSSDVVVVYVGLDEVTESEGLDRAKMKLPNNQVELLKALRKTGKKIVAVMHCGSAIEMDWQEYADSVLHAYLGGQAGAKAIFDVLVGNVNPSGKLSETYPVKYEDTPTAADFHFSEMSVEYRESIFVGYRYFDTANVKVAYPFGYGLSYTKFEYSNLKVDKEGVSFTIKNIGAYDGAEVAQLYVGLPVSKVFRPKKELKGFKKVFIKKGESALVTIPFDEYTFRFYNSAANAWEIESGEYVLSVGASVADIKLTDNLSVEGNMTKAPYAEADFKNYFNAHLQSIGTAEFEKLLGFKVPNPSLNFYKKKRIVVGYNTTIAQLRYSRRWIGRLFSGGIKFAINMLKAFGQRKTANTLLMGVYYQPMRGLSRMTGGALSWGQVGGLIHMFNGHFFKGFGRFLKEGKIKKRIHKQEKAALNSVKKQEKP